MLLILFGHPGVGKNYVGEILRDDFNFFFYGGDEDLTPEIKELFNQKKAIGDGLRDSYFNYLMKNIKELQKKHEKIVFVQALTKEKYRLLIKENFPEAIFIFIKAPIEVTKDRLRSRRHLVDEGYAKKIMKFYEDPQLEHEVIINDEDREKAKTQIEEIIDELGK